MTKRVLSILLPLCLCLTLLPTSAFALVQTGGNFPYVNESGNTTQAGNCTTVTSSDTAWGEAGGTKWYVVNSANESSKNVTINGVTLKGDVRLILGDGMTLTVSGSGIHGDSGSSLTIYGQSGGTGKLIVTDTASSSTAYGIYVSSGLTINGGTVEAKALNANTTYGIYVSNGSLTVNRGSVTAMGGDVTGGQCESYGIYARNGVSVTGGTVNATGGAATISGGTDINYGSYGIYIDSGDLTISGGAVSATGGEVSMSGSSVRGARSGGVQVRGGSLSMTGGTLTATGSKVTVSGKNDSFSVSGDSCGVYAYNNVIFGGTALTATGGDVSVTRTDDSSDYSSDSSGIFASTGSVTVSSGTVALDHGTAASAVDLFAHGLTVSGGSMTLEKSTVMGDIKVENSVKLTDLLAAGYAYWQGTLWNETGSYVDPADTSELTKPSNGNNYIRLCTHAGQTNQCDYCKQTVNTNPSTQKTTPTVTWPTVDGTVYVNDGEINSNRLTGGSATGTGEAAVPGSFGFYGPNWALLKSVGTKTFTVQFTPEDTEHYNTVDKTDFEVTVIKRAVTSVETFNTTIEKEFGTAQDSLGLPVGVTIRVSGNKSFTVPVTWSGYDSQKLGEQTLTGTLGLTDYADEVDNPDNKTASIKVKLNARTINTTLESKIATYTGSPIKHELEALPEGVASVKYEYESNNPYYPKSETAPTAVGTYHVTATFTMKNGYAQLDTAHSYLTINKRSHTLTVSIDGWTYGDTANTPSVTGLPEGMSLSSTGVDVDYRDYVTERPVGGVPANAGSYEVLVSYETDTDSYFGSKEFTIAKRSATVGPKSYTITQGDAIPTFELEWSGVLAGDDVTTTKPLTDAGITCYETGTGTPVSSSTAAGTYNIRWINGDEFYLTGNDAANYNFNKVSMGTLTIQPKSSGGGSSSSSSSYAITASETKNGSVTISPKSAAKGATVTLTVTPDTGYVLEALTVLDKNGNALELTDLGGGKYSFKMPAGKVTVNATFMDDNTILNFFTDVPADSYYYDAVLWAAKNGITGGVDENHFGPDLGCTRAQLVTFLWRAAGCPVVDYAMDFTDVVDDYYTEAVRWAASLGIVGGYGNGEFGTNDAVTREQVVTILYRFAKSIGMDTSVGEDTNILSYNDAFEVSEYAVEAFQWATGADIVQGANGNLMPKDGCTRAQIVTMLWRLLGEQNA